MFVNGKEMNIESGITVDDLINKLNIDKDKIVVEVNFEIIRKEEYCDRILVDSDKIEIIAFVGGG
ncbi:sulfur carrier protein ThiS [Clostridium tepidiprofundi DSM 19306]|uniref:Sulfur carrier protein ThiS n=1 Tax=Clostridium tepidiprofundi DSM 19306 TaxID=1121338 RepID=A0A151B6A4_9CLOT|nr:sulfur carrier protein ThiS [Clostridium tepidiprofundi]KYH35310.1 sulfur carrier protein ThiS [Clostridium tepidiprofundi DSM 19306]